MKKKAYLAALAATCAFAFAAPAFAAPSTEIFADVPAKHWAYEAVYKLAKDGIVSGDAGRFMGDRTITRYEMAVMVANAMTKVEKADASQKALIDKLSKEFSADLEKLGARVSAVEAKVKSLEAGKPNVKMGGQSRVTYAYRNDGMNLAAAGLNQNKHDYFTYRLRVEGTYAAGDWTFFSRIRGQNYDVESGSLNKQNANLNAGSFNQTKVEQFWVNVKNPFGVEKTQLTFGRQGVLLGKGGVVMQVGDADMVMADYANKGVTYKLALKNNPQASAVGADPVANAAPRSREIYSQIGGKVGQTNVTVFNMKGIQDYSTSRNITAIGLDTKVGQKVSFFGEYAKNSGQATDNKVYWFGLTNGYPGFHPDLSFTVNMAKKGDNAQALIYRHYEANAIGAGENQLHSVLGNEAAGGALWLAGTKGFEFYTTHVLEKNIVLVNKFGTAKFISNGQKVSDYALFQLYAFF